MIPDASVHFSVLRHPSSAAGCTPCLAGTWLARLQADQGVAAGYVAPRSVPGYVGDAKDNPKPVLVWGLGRKDLTMSLGTAAGEPGVATSRYGEQLDALGLLNAVSLLFCDLARPVGSLISSGMAAGSMAARRAAGPAMASPIAIENFWHRPGWRGRKRRNRCHTFQEKRV